MGLRMVLCSQAQGGDKEDGVDCALVIVNVVIDVSRGAWPLFGGLKLRVGVDQ